MPGLNRTGPEGQGPRTGRGLGPCGGGTGWRGWRRWGRGLGFGRFWSAKNKKDVLEDEEKTLEEELREVRKEKAALEDEKK
ncbi:MAG: DUF5320 domain-containing protein [Patescibacteria group bacterium]|nr:DUF5320 domain-containing protein [Patescibacteria group bacterium]